MKGIIDRLQSWLRRSAISRWPAGQKTEFSISAAFPHSDALAIDILRLLAAYNDLSSINEWALKESRDKNNISTLAHISLMVSKTDLHLRLLGSVMHETLRTIEDFERLRSSDMIILRLTIEAKAAYDRLLKIAKGQESASTAILKLARNKLSYHYDRKTFEEGLRIHSAKDDTSYVLMLDEEIPQRGFYFPLADDLRTYVVDKHKDNNGISLQLIMAVELQHLFKVLLLNALLIYSQDKGTTFGLETVRPPT